MVTDRDGSAPRRSGADAQVFAARGDHRRAPKRRPRGFANQRVTLCDVDVRAVQADDQREPAPRHGRDDAARDDPMPVDDGRLRLANDAPRRAPRGEDGRRRRGERRGLERDVGLQRFRVPEDVERLRRGVAKQVERDAALLQRARPPRVPRQHHVDLVAAGGQAFGDRLHERADRISLKPRVRGRHHHHAVACAHGALRPIDLSFSRQGVSADSTITLPDSFETPCRRSTKMIGTSPTRAPRRCASNSISTRNA